MYNLLSQRFYDATIDIFIMIICVIVKHNTSYICELIDTETKKMSVTYQYTFYAELKPLTLLKWAMVCFTA